MGHPLTPVGFMEMRPTQDACRRALLEQRWREGFRCPRCAHAVAWYSRGRGLCEGAGFDYRASLTAGVLLHKALTDLRRGLLTTRLRRGDHELLLRGTVEFDESLLGGGERNSGKLGRAVQRQTLVAKAAEQTPEGGRGGAHLRLIDDAGAKNLTKVAGAQMPPGGAVKSDGCSAYWAPPGAAFLPEPFTESTPPAAREMLPFGANRYPPTSSAGNSTSFLASAPRTCSSTSTSSATGSGRRVQRLDLLRHILKRCVLYTPPNTFSQLIAA